MPWAAYFAALGTPRVRHLNVSVPAYVSAYDAQLGATPLATWKAYLRFHVADGYASALPKRFDDASFAFRSGTLLGVKEQLPRWQRCTTATDASLRDVLGKVYVAQAFPPAAKARALALVTNLQDVLRDDIRTLDWMSPPTRARAVVKLDAFTKKIGYPDKLGGLLDAARRRRGRCAEQRRGGARAGTTRAGWRASAPRPTAAAGA